MFCLAKKAAYTITVVFLLGSVSHGVYGGEPLDENMRKSLVNIKFERGVCSGVLIAPTTVMTAGHCKDRSLKPEWVAYLNPDKKAPSLDCYTSQVIDSRYEPGAKPIFPRKVHSPDILLLRLKKPICGAAPAQVQSRPLHSGDVLTTTGYGGRGGQGLFFESHQMSLEIIETPAQPEKLMVTDLKIFLDLAALAHESYRFALPAQENTTLCSGDSGGPLFINDEGQMLVYGVNGSVFPHLEMGAEKCGNGYLHLLTPVAPYYEWIESVIEEWG